MLEKKVCAPKVAALSTVQTERFPKLIGRRFSNCVQSAREHAGFRTSYGYMNKENCPSRPFTRF
jgi:hypothetical protein